MGASQPSSHWPKGGTDEEATSIGQIGLHARSERSRKFSLLINEGKANRPNGEKKRANTRVKRYLRETQL